MKPEALSRVVAEESALIQTSTHTFKRVRALKWTLTGGPKDSQATFWRRLDGYVFSLIFGGERLGRRPRAPVRVSIFNQPSAF